MELRKGQWKPVILLSLFLTWALLQSLACTRDVVELSPVVPAPTPVPVVVAVNYVYYTYSYNNSSVFIPRGGSVIWDSSNTGHTLNIDNGTGGCALSGQTSFPVTYTFNTKGTFQFHCGIHSSCGDGSCPGSCTGMAGTITVN